MYAKNGLHYDAEYSAAKAVPYSGRERRVENDPCYFGYFALEGVERRQSNNAPYTGEERRKVNDPEYFGYFALEGIERRQSHSIFS